MTELQGKELTDKKSRKKIAFGLLIMSLTLAGNSALSPIISEISKAFPNEGDATVQSVVTMINLVMLPMFLLEPVLERFVSKKNIALLGTALMTFGAILPQFIYRYIWQLYLISIVLGTGVAFVIVVSSSLISDYFSGIEKSVFMGYQSIFVSVGGGIIAQGSGYLAGKFGWRNGYLVFLITIPILIIVLLTVPSTMPVLPQTWNQHFSISRRLWYYAIICLALGIFSATFNTNLSLFFVRRGIGGTREAGTVSSIMQLTGIAAGLLLGRIVARLKKYTIAFATVLMALGTCITVISHLWLIICIGAVLMGLGFAVRNAAGVTFAANMVSRQQTSASIAIVSAAYNLGYFLNACVVNGISKFISTDIRVRFYLSGAMLLAIALITGIKVPVSDREAVDAEPEEGGTK